VSLIALLALHVPFVATNTHSSSFHGEINSLMTMVQNTTGHGTCPTSLPVPKPYTLNLIPETLNPKAETENPLTWNTNPYFKPTF